MSHILTLKVPDDVYSELESNAFAQGVEVEDFCLRRLRNGTPDALLPTEEVEIHPLMKLAGIFDSETPDLAERHDYYLAEGMMNTHDHEK